MKERSGRADHRAETRAKLRESLIRLLKASGSSKAELADALGVSRAAVSNWTEGTCSVDIGYLPGLCDYFEVTADELLGRSRCASLLPDEEHLLDVYRRLPEPARFNLRQIGRLILWSVAYPDPPVEDG